MRLKDCIRSWGEIVPIVSIIVPVYNGAEFLRPCLDSILSQTLRELEVILVDDGSTDESPAICDSYASMDPRVICIHQENAGAAVARNTGLLLATGKYIAFVDCDDWIDRGMYENMVNAAEKQDCDLTICDCVKESDSGTQLYTHELPGGYYDRDTMLSQYFPQLLMTDSMEYPVTISNWCTNKVQPSLETLMEISKVLNVDVKELIRSSIETTNKNEA